MFQPSSNNSSLVDVFDSGTRGQPLQTDPWGAPLQRVPPTSHPPDPWGAPSAKPATNTAPDPWSSPVAASKAAPQPHTPSADPWGVPMGSPAKSGAPRGSTPGIVSQLQISQIKVFMKISWVDCGFVYFFLH